MFYNRGVHDKCYSSCRQTALHLKRPKLVAPVKHYDSSCYDNDEWIFDSVMKQFLLLHLLAGKFNYLFYRTSFFARSSSMTGLQLLEHNKSSLSLGVPYRVSIDSSKEQ